MTATRAGRRHLEKVGNVVFVGFRYETIKELLGAPLKELSPKLPVTLSYIMKASQSETLTEAISRSSVRESMNSTMCNPLFRALTDEHRLQFLEEALMHSVLFAWHFLVELGFILPDGKTVLRSELVDKLYYLEPNCFVLAHLIGDVENPRGGLQKLYEQAFKLPFQARKPNSKMRKKNPDRYHKLVEEAEAGPKKDFKEQLLRLLIYTLSPVPISGGERAVPGGLHPAIRGSWKDYNSKVTGLLTRYGIRQGERISERGLPLDDSGLIDLDHGGGAASDELRALRDYLQGYRVQAHARSSFTALSGRGDDFANVLDMELSSKEGLFVNPDMIPAVDPNEHVLGTTWRVIQEQDFVSSDGYDKQIKKRADNFMKHVKSVGVCLRSQLKVYNQKLAPAGGSRRHYVTEDGKKILEMVLEVTEEAVRSIRIAQSKVVDGEGVVVYVPRNHPQAPKADVDSKEAEEEGDDDEEKEMATNRKDRIKIRIFNPRYGDGDSTSKSAFLDEIAYVDPSDVDGLPDWQVHRGQRVWYRYDKELRKGLASVHPKATRRITGTVVAVQVGTHIDEYGRSRPKTKSCIEYDHTDGPSPNLWLQSRDHHLALHWSAYRSSQPIKHYPGAPVVFDLEWIPRGKKGFVAQASSVDIREVALLWRSAVLVHKNSVVDVRGEEQGRFYLPNFQTIYSPEAWEAREDETWGLLVKVLINTGDYVSYIDICWKKGKLETDGPAKNKSISVDGYGQLIVDEKASTAIKDLMEKMVKDGVCEQDVLVALRKIDAKEGSPHAIVSVRGVV